MADSPMKVKVEVDDTRMKDLTREIKEQEKEIRAWNQLNAQGLVTQKQFDKGIADSTIKLREATTQLKQLQAATQSGFGTGGAQGLLQMSYAIDDLQYGFRAIVNNIPQIAMSIGGPNAMAIAGAAGIAAVAVNQLIQHWGALSDAMSVAFVTDNITDFARLNEELATARKRAEEATAAFEKLAATPTKRKAAAGAGMKDLITEGPTDQFLKGTAEAIAQDPGMKATAEDRTLGEKFAVMGPLSKAIAGALGVEGGTKADDARNVQKAKELLGKASEGDKVAMMQLESLAKAQPGKFPPEFLQDVRDLTPEGQKRIEQNRIEAQGQHNARVMGEEEKARKEKEKEDQNRLEIEGRKNAKKSDKDTVIRGLEDERTRVQRAQRDFDDKMWERTHEQSRGSVMAGGAENLIRMYQAGAGGVDSPKELAKQAHDQRERTIKALEKIEDQMKEARKVIIN